MQHSYSVHMYMESVFSVCNGDQSVPHGCHVSLLTSCLCVRGSLWYSCNVWEVRIRKVGDEKKFSIVAVWTVVLFIQSAL